MTVLEIAQDGGAVVSPVDWLVSGAIAPFATAV